MSSQDCCVFLGSEARIEWFWCPGIWLCDETMRACNDKSILRVQPLGLRPVTAWAKKALTTSYFCAIFSACIQKYHAKTIKTWCKCAASAINFTAKLRVLYNQYIPLHFYDSKAIKIMSIFSLCIGAVCHLHDTSGAPCMIYAIKTDRFKHWIK